MSKHIPVRSCAACGKRSSKRELIRIVRTLTGKVEVDRTGKKPGRGTYLCPNQECWNRGLKGSRLDHLLRSPLTEGDKEALVNYYKEELMATGVGDVR